MLLFKLGRHDSFVVADERASKSACEASEALKRVSYVMSHNAALRMHSWLLRLSLTKQRCLHSPYLSYHPSQVPGHWMNDAFTRKCIFR